MAITKITNSLVAVNAIAGTLIADNAITSVHIAQNQVTSVQIPDSSITSTQLAANSVDTAELISGSIDAIHLASDSVTTAKILDANVTTAKIANNAITSALIPDGSITDTQLGSGAFTMGNITTTGSIRGPASLTIDPATVGDNTGTVVIAGNLQVDGTTTTINSTQLSVADKKITVGKGSGSSSAANESGFEVGVGADGASSNPSMLYSSSGTKFVINKPLDITGNVTATRAVLTDGITDTGQAGSSTTFNNGGTTADFIVKSSGNATMLVVDGGTNRVGIGTNSPTSPLDVSGVITSKADAAVNDAQIGRLNFTNTNSNASSNPIRASILSGRQNSAWGGYLSLYTSTGTSAASEKVRIGETGNVGIGETVPLVKLDVRGSASAPATSGTAQTGSLRVSQTVGNGVLDMGFYTSSNGTAWLQSTNKTNLATNYDIALQPNGGKVGIGITAPIAPLTINNYLASASNNTDIFVKNPSVEYTNDDPHIYNAGPDGIIVTSNTSRTDGPDKMGLVLYNDDATAGGFSPMLLFAKRETGSTPFRATMAGIYAKAPLGTGNSGAWIDGQLHFATAGAATEGIKSRMVIDKEGNVGIGTDSPNSWASYTDSAATILQVEDSSQRARIVINGGNGAHLDLVDYAGASNDKHMNIAVDAGLLKFGSLNDAGNAFVQNNIMTMDLGTGNVGIGTDTPTLVAGKIVHIHGSAAGVHLTDTASGTTSGDGAYFVFDNPNLYIQQKEAGPMIFETSGTERMRIAADGLATFTSTRSEWAMRLNTAGSRAGIVLDKPGTTTIMGSVLMLSDETFRLGTASNYHIRMDQTGDTYMGNSSSTHFTQNGNLSVNTTTENAGITSGTDVRALGPCFANDANSFTMSQEGTGNTDAYLAARGPNGSTNGNIRIGVSVSGGGGFKTGVRIDNQGRTTTPENPAFRYRATAAQVLNNGWQQVGYGTLKEERGTGYSSTNSRFTAPVAGWYQFNAAWTANNNSDVDGTLAIWINGSSSDLVSSTSMPNTGGSYDGHFCGGCCYLDVDDYVQVHRYSTVTTTTRSSAPYGGWFSGFLIG